MGGARRPHDSSRDAHGLGKETQGDAGVRQLDTRQDSPEAAPQVSGKGHGTRWGWK